MIQSRAMSLPAPATSRPTGKSYIISPSVFSLNPAASDETRKHRTQSTETDTERERERKLLARVRSQSRLIWRPCSPEFGSRTTADKNYAKSAWSSVADYLH